MRRGLSLVEVAVSLCLLSLLMGLMFHIYRLGSMSWRKTEGQTELLHNCQVVTSRLAREVERSVYASASAGPGAVAFLSAVNVTTGEVSLNPTTMLARWQQYLVFYFDAPSRQVFLRNVALLPSDPEGDTPRPIEQYATGGPQPLANWLNQGKVLARDIYRCDFLLNDGTLTVSLEGEKPPVGNAPPEKLSLRTTTLFRN